MKHKHKHPHKKVRKPVRVRKSFAFNVKEFRWIEDISNRHQGKDIWVVCPGAQLDQYPDDFFDDKISIALRTVICGWPNCTYSMFAYRQVGMRMYAGKNYSSLKDKIILKVFRYDHPQWKEPTYYLHSHHGATEDYYFDLPKWMLPLKKIRTGAPHSYLAHRSILQDGIQAAIILGAHRVILVACFHKGVGNQYHAQRRGMDRFYPGDKVRRQGHRLHYLQGKIEGQKKSEQANRWLAQAFKPYGIQILRHHYGKEGFEDLAIRPLTLKERKRLAAPRKLTRKERKQLAALRRSSK